MAKKSAQKFIARNRAPRVQIEYDVEVYGAEKKVQLPFVMGVMADLSGKPEEALPTPADQHGGEEERDRCRPRRPEAGEQHDEDGEEAVAQADLCEGVVEGEGGLWPAQGAEEDPEDHQDEGPLEGVGPHLTRVLPLGPARGQGEGEGHAHQEAGLAHTRA